MYHSNTLIVSAAIIIEHKRVLLTQRKKNVHLPSMWEFPGGKVEHGEDPERALERELKEELGIAVQTQTIFDVRFHHYSEKNCSMLLLFYEAIRLDPSLSPTCIDVADWKWGGLSDLDPYNFPPADFKAVLKVRKRIGT